MVSTLFLVLISKRSGSKLILVFEVLDIDNVQGLVAVEPQLPNGRPGRQREPVGLRRHSDLLQMGSTRADLKADGLLDDG